MTRIVRICVGAIAAFTLLGTAGVSALEKQTSYQYNEKGVSHAAPEAYTVERVWYAQDNGTTALNGPTDLFVGQDGTVYISDTGNSRILVLDSNWKLRREIRTVRLEGEEQPLSDPQGVFAGADGLLYICDTGNQRVIAIDGKSDVRRRILGENIVSVQELYEFKPERVAVDSMGNVYVVSSSIYQGILRFSKEDTFSAFFAPNEVRKTLSTWLISILKSFFTDAQKDTVEKMLPDPYNNLFIDADDFIYTTARAEAGKDLKKNSLTGRNILESAHHAKDRRFGDIEFSVNEGSVTESEFIDVHADGEGIISILDKSANRIYQYTQECDLIAIFGGKGDHRGQFLQVSAMEKQGDRYLVLDQQAGSVTVFRPTAYIGKVRAALGLYDQGLYTQAESLWKEVLEENRGMVLAYKGIGRAALQQNDLDHAMEYLKKGADSYFYSIAFREYRKDFVRRHIVLLLIGVAVFVAGFILLFGSARRYLLSGRSKEKRVGRLFRRSHSQKEDR